MRPLESVAVKGRRGELTVHGLLSIAGTDDPELKVPYAALAVAAVVTSASVISQSRNALILRRRIASAG
ncbi:hypothetical protein BH10PSE6_BH10PSE6_00420 [soil metagenome]